MEMRIMDVGSCKRVTIEHDSKLVVSDILDEKEVLSLAENLVRLAKDLVPEDRLEALKDLI